MYKILETNRLLIRPITTGDNDFIFNLVNTQGWLTFIGDRKIRSSDDAENYIQKILDNEKFFYSVFEIKETNIPMGIITFLNRENQEFPDIGFAMLPEFEKKGYAFKACKKYLDEIIRNKISPQIMGITIPENNNSIKLLTHLGLEFMKTKTEDHQTLSIYSMKIH